ncbi:chemotaxis protein [Caballeronia sp. 15715]|uniref:chemotaxis protein n=1 Tax=unclassified Caballeronia TaxID=2646786 RepID=UPI0039E6788D
MMSGSTLDPDEEGGVEVGKGHGTGALGPSDSSDSGSDVQGEKRYPGDIEDELDAHAVGQSAAELNSDTDRYGTGEMASADGDNNLQADSDILPDGVEDETRAIDDETADPASDEEPGDEEL